MIIDVGVEILCVDGLKPIPIEPWLRLRKEEIIGQDIATIVNFGKVVNGLNILDSFAQGKIERHQIAKANEANNPLKN